MMLSPVTKSDFPVDIKDRFSPSVKFFPRIRVMTRFKSCPRCRTLWLFCMFFLSIGCTSRSRWPRGLRRGSAAARLLGLRVRIPPGHGCLSLVSVMCCQVDVSASGWSLVHRSPNECGASECGLETTTMRRLGPLGLSSDKKNLGVQTPPDLTHF